MRDTAIVLARERPTVTGAIAGFVFTLITFTMPSLFTTVTDSDHGEL